MPAYQYLPFAPGDLVYLADDAPTCKAGLYSVLYHSCADIYAIYMPSKTPTQNNLHFVTADLLTLRTTPHSLTGNITESKVYARCIVQPLYYRDFDGNFLVIDNNVQIPSNDFIIAASLPEVAKEYAKTLDPEAIGNVKEITIWTAIFYGSDRPLANLPTTLTLDARTGEILSEAY